MKMKMKQQTGRQIESAHEPKKKKTFQHQRTQNKTKNKTEGKKCERQREKNKRWRGGEAATVQHFLVSLRQISSAER